MAAGEEKSGNVLTRPDVRNCAGLMLVALVPRPGTHQLRHYGLLAARSELRHLSR